jgi:hypothetical protein
MSEFPLSVPLHRFVTTFEIDRIETIMELDVRRASSARDLAAMTGWIDADGRHHEGDGVARLVHSVERGWALWFLCEAGGQTVLSSRVLPVPADCDEVEVMRRLRAAALRVSGGVKSNTRN